MGVIMTLVGVVMTPVGVVMTLHVPGEGCAFIEPAALKPDWSLRL